VLLGLSYANIKFFYKNKATNNQQNFLWLSLLGVFVNLTVFLLLFFLMAQLFPSIKESNLWKMKWLILLLVWVLSFSQLLNKYISNLKRIVVPNIFENLFPKLANLSAFCLLFYMGVSEKLAYWVFFLFFVVALLGYFYYLYNLEGFNVSLSTGFLQKNNFLKEVVTYSLFIFMGNIGNFIATRIDNYMIGEYIGFKENGIYSTFLSIIGLITIPQMGLYSISAPIINKALEENKYADLNTFHKKTALNLFFVGLTLFTCILVGFPYLTTFIKNGEQFLPYQNILTILGFSLLFDLATGFNGYIISMSKYFKFNMVVMLFLAISTILFNYYFINYTELGIIGVAIATSIALTLFNLIKIIFNYIKFGVFPLSIKMFFACTFALIGYFASGLLVNLSSPFLNLIFKPLIVLLVMFVANYVLTIFPLQNILNKTFIKNLFTF
ncbi:MAG: lipopolysaccharide biosynthesis protein, partial [Solirubrobacteraceae bacterium]